MKIKPLHDRIVIAPREADGVTAGGIIIPDNAKERPQRGVVVAVGSGTRNKDGALVPLAVKVGDVVLWGKYSGTEVKLSLSGEQHVVIREDDVLAVIE